MSMLANASFGFDDVDLARRLQEEYDMEAAAQLAAETNSDLSRSSADDTSNHASRFGSELRSPLGISPVDPSLEITDPNPDIRELFLLFNAQFFWGRLSGIEVKWSPRMTLCAGLCVYEGHGGLCSVRLSLPLLKLRPRKDLVETLLHEMIHAFLFVTDHEKDHDDHGPNFKKHMYRINKETGANISIYHTFHDEVASYQQHWWKCDGPCQKRPPYFGMVRRAMNRPPSQRDPWFGQHQATCGGTFIKVKEPEGYGQKKGKSKPEKNDKNHSLTSDIRSFVGKGTIVIGGSSSAGNSMSSGNVTSTNGNKKGAEGRGLSVITNGILNKKNPVDKKSGGSNIQQPGKNSSPLFSSIASTSSTSGTNRKNSTSISNTSSSGSLNQPPSSTIVNRFSTGSTGQSSNKPIKKGKGNFNDNITLLDLFKQRQAREKAKKEGRDIKNEFEGNKIHSAKEDSDSDNKHKSGRDEVKTKGIKKETDEDFKDYDDFVVDLTGPEETSSSSSTKKRPSDSKPKDKVNGKKHWKNIFPNLSGKKHRDKSKVTSKGKFPNNFVSVCEGGDYGDLSARLKQKRPKGEKRKRKYIIDELDCNDNLWEEGGSSASASEEKLVSFKNSVDNKHTSQSDLTDEDYSESDREKKLSHSDSNLSDPDGSKQHARDSQDQAVSNKDTVEAGPSTSRLSGHVLGRGETGFSFLAQVRRTLQDERNQNQNVSLSRSTVENSDYSMQRGSTSQKRSSDAAFGGDDVVPTAKKHNSNSREEFATEYEDHRDSDNDAAHGMVACPACNQLVPESKINDHLDRCLL